eukprot:TRINITY_DN10715_c0_g1_i1.p1 TRINITY_DN10715_c0_g1~~TRINITY_DN10715_c0_g1_i1.p1  ORF type:complete len:731 (+),score=77.88 TRINITY_DN10715_c0_g1_i1:43-2235(+)
MCIRDSFKRAALNARSHFQWLKLRIQSTRPAPSPQKEVTKITGNTPEERVVKAIRQSWSTDKTVLCLKDFGIGPAFPSQLWSMHFLVDLDVSCNQITSIPEKLGILANLESFKINNNNLTSVPKEIWGQLTNLKHFHCADNQLSSIPKELFHADGMSFLDLSSNQIRSIPSEISNLTQLTFLDIANNLLEALPTVHDLDSLEELLAGGNKLKQFPISWAELPSIVTLDFHNNLMTTVPDSFIIRLRSHPDLAQSFVIKDNPLHVDLINEIQQSQSIAKNSRAKLSLGGLGESKDILELLRMKSQQGNIPKSPATHKTIPATQANSLSGKCLWVEEAGYTIEKPEVGKKSIEPFELILMEHINKADYVKSFLPNTHVNIIGTEKKIGPVCISIMKDTSASAPASNIAGNRKNTGDGELVYRFLVRTKQGDHVLGLPAKEVKKRKKERIARSDDLLAALCKHCKPYGFNFSTKYLWPIRHRDSHEAFGELESKLISNSSKIGIIYAKDGQNETEMYNNRVGSEAFENFLELISEKIEMFEWPHYRGDLSNKTKQTARYTRIAGHEIMYHVSTYLTYQEVTDAEHQQWERKRFLGNDICIVVFYEGNTPIYPSTFVSHFNHVFAMVQPVDINGEVYYRLHFAAKMGVVSSIPRLPENPIVSADQIKKVLLTKLVNTERCAMSAPHFRRAHEKVREELFYSLHTKFPKKSFKRRNSNMQDLQQCYMAVNVDRKK